jgi:hypothetical protein
LELDFGINEMDGVGELRGLAREDVVAFGRGDNNVLDLMLGKTGRGQMGAKQPAGRVAEALSRPMVLQEPDSDDESSEEDDDLAAFDMDEDEFPQTTPVADAIVTVSKPRAFVPPSKMAIKDSNKVKILPPTYVRELVAYLRASSEDALKQEMALVHAVAAMRSMHELDWKENGAELAIWLLRCDDTYDLDNYMQLRSAALRELVSRGAKQVIPVVVDAFYDRNFNLSQRLEILDALAVAARDLSSLDDDSAEEDPTLVPLSAELGHGFPTSTGRNLEEISARIAQNTRRFSKKAMVDRSRKPPKPNKWNAYAEKAVLSLIGRLGSRSNQWDPLRDRGSEASLVLDRLLMCATSMVWCSANVPALRQMCRELFDCAWGLRCVSAPAKKIALEDEFDAVMSRSDMPATVALAITVAFSMLSQYSYGRGGLDLFYGAFSDGEVTLVAEWAVDLIEQGTGGDIHRTRAAGLLGVIKEILEARRSEVFGDSVNELL